MTVIGAGGYRRAKRLVRSSFPALAATFAALFMAYGTESPFLPAFLRAHGTEAGQLGVLLAAGTVVRLLVTPFIGQAADRHRAVRATLALFGFLAGVSSFTYLLGSGFLPLLALSMLNAFATAPLAPLADALALPAAERDSVFDYGWVRGVGSGAFVVGTLVSGRLVEHFGLSSIVVSSGVLFLVIGGLAWLAPEPAARDGIRAEAARSGWRDLIADPVFRRVSIVAALVIGSHAFNDTFAVIHWSAAGVSSGTIGLLWSESVVSEVVVFLFLGPPLLARLGPARCAALSALAGCLRWACLALTDHVVVLAAVQLTHGLTFALLHLANMRVIGARVPPDRIGAAQALYATVGLGLSSAVLTALSGVLYARIGVGVFWVAVGLCAVAVPLTRGLRDAVSSAPLPHGRARDELSPPSNA